MGIITLISNAFGAIKAFFGFAEQRDAEENAPDVKAAAEARNEQNAQDQTKKAIAQQNLDEERKELSE